MREIVNPANVDGVLYVAASQGGGKTAIALVAWAYFAVAEPSPQLLVTYSLEMAEQLSKHRIATMIRANTCLATVISEARTARADGNNTIRDKVYPGGAGTLVGSNSAGGLSMHPKRVLISDELDRWAKSAGKEGSPLELALTRLKSYQYNARKLYVTSPGVKNASESWLLWQRSDQREWFVTCADCGHAQVLTWKQVVWQKDADGVDLPETATYGCVACGSAWDDAARWRASKAGEYRPTATFRGLYGCRVNALAIETWTLREMVKQWLRAQGDPEKLQVFQCTVLCEWWVDAQLAKLEEHALMARREVFAKVGEKAVVPAAAALLTAGVDLQESPPRFEITVDAWGSGEECWRLKHHVIRGDLSHEAVWHALEAYLLEPWPRALGGVDYLRGVAIDTGGASTQQAYDFCASRFRRLTPDGGQQFVFAIKGVGGVGEFWPREPSKTATRCVLWPIRVDAGKEQIYGRLALTKIGPGYVHLSDELDRAYIDGLTAEQCVLRKGRRVWEKKSPGARNEQLDCANYSYAALCGLRANGLDVEAEVAKLPHRVLFDPTMPPTPTPAVAAPQRKPWVEPRTAADGGGWLGDTNDWLGNR